MNSSQHQRSQEGSDQQNTDKELQIAERKKWRLPIRSLLSKCCDLNVSRRLMILTVPTFIIAMAFYLRAGNSLGSYALRVDGDSRPVVISTITHAPTTDDKPKAAIYYLIGGWRKVETTFKYSLKALDLFFNNKYKYPIIIFYTQNQTDIIPEIRNWTSSQIIPIKVDFHLPSFVDATKAEYHYCSGHPLGYKHMCRFQAKLVYEIKFMQQFDYLWRLDDDSLIREPINYDVFKKMRNENLLYGYKVIQGDSPKCVDGLWKTAETFIKANNISAHFFKDWPSPKIYYNNFEISSTKLWFSPGYKAFIDYIDNTGNIFYRRWGDAPIKSLAVSIFVPKNQTYYFKDISYQHPFNIRNLPPLLNFVLTNK